MPFRLFFDSNVSVNNYDVSEKGKLYNCNNTDPLSLGLTPGIYMLLELYSNRIMTTVVSVSLPDEQCG